MRRKRERKGVERFEAKPASKYEKGDGTDVRPRAKIPRPAPRIKRTKSRVRTAGVERIRSGRISVSLSATGPLGLGLNQRAGGVRVHSISRDGDAQRSGLIQIGDRLISVNGKDVSRKNLKAVCICLRDALRPVALVVDRSKDWQKKDKDLAQDLTKMTFGLSADGEYYTARPGESEEDAVRRAGGPLRLAARVYRVGGR